MRAPSSNSKFDVGAVALVTMASSAIRQDDLLVQAASRGELEKVRAMLDHGAVVKGNNKMLTALHWAVTMGHRDVVALLIERGANVEAKAADGHTPLHMAAREGDAQMVQCLLEARANPNSTNNASQTAVDLALAFAEDEPEVAQVLLAAGARRHSQLITAKPMPTRTPMLQMSEVLTSDGPASVGCGTEDLQSAMAALSTHAVLGAPPKPQVHELAKPASVACGTDDLESLMAGLVGQLSSDSEPHVATLSG